MLKTEVKEQNEVLTSLQDLLDLDVVCTEAAVVLEVVGVVEEGSSQREEELLQQRQEMKTRNLQVKPD